MTSGSGTPGPFAADAWATLVRPRLALQAAASDGAWIAWALKLAIVSALANGLLLSTSVGQLALADQWERAVMAVGSRVDDAGYAMLQASSERFWALYAASRALLLGPVLSALLALVVYAAYRGARRRRPTFGATAAVVVRASTILAIRDLVGAPVSYLREAMTAPGSLGLWFPVPNATSPMARLLGVVDVFVVWWVVVLAIGVGMLHGRSARRLGLLFLGVYLVGALLLAAGAAVADSGG